MLCNMKMRMARVLRRAASMISSIELETGPIDGTTSLKASRSFPETPIRPLLDTRWPVGLNP